MSVSLFKNAFCQFPKADKIIAELPVRSVDTTYGPPITCNTENIYFALGGGDVGIIPLLEFGKRRFNVPLLISSSNNLVSLASTYLNPIIFSSLGQNDAVKIWKKDQKTTPFHSLATDIKPINDETFRNMAFHPCTDQILACVSNKSVSVVNLEKPDMALKIDTKLDFSSISWKEDGSILVCGSEAGDFGIIDPRTPANNQEMSHPMKKAKVIWAGKSNYIISVGFNQKTQNRSVYSWDIRNTSTHSSKKDLDSSISYSYPVYDSDTGMLVVAVRGAQLSHFLEFDGTKLSEPRTDQHDEATLGICSFPRTALNVMSCEVMRILQLGKASISHISYEVMRKSKSTYYPELFPDAKDCKSSITASEWFSGQNKELSRVSLEPKKDTPSPNSAEVAKSPNDDLDDPIQTIKFISDESLSKFKNMFSNAFHKKFGHDMLNTVDLKSNSESNGIACNFDTLALPLMGAAGKIGILQLSKPGRVPDCGPFYVENKSSYNDFEIDKKNDKLLAVACDNSYINIWKFNKLPLEENVIEPTKHFSIGGDRPTIIKFHPCANQIVSTAGLDGIIRAFDFENGKCLCSCQDSENAQSLSFDWNEVGSMVAGLSTDRICKIFDPRAAKESKLKSEQYLGTGQGRIIFIDDNTVFVSGFLPRGTRVVALHDLRNFKTPQKQFPLDEAPSVLIPFYDIDNKLIYLSAKGECNILPIELRNDDTGIMMMPKYYSPDPHSAVCFLRKDVCDVRKVEVARCIRLIKGSTELVEFTVPRTRSEYFQDDLYPPTRKVWESSMTVEDFVNKKDKLQGVLDLKPEDMVKMSEADLGGPKAAKYNSRAELRKGLIKKEEDTGDFLGMVMGKAKLREDDPIVQDERQGIDESEWDD